MNDVTLKILQSIGIIVALLFTAYQFYRFRNESIRQRYLEIDRRYIDCLKQAMSMGKDDIPIGYDRLHLQHFLDLGGSKQEILFYDLLFSTWESAFLLYNKHTHRQWQGWEEWIRAFFVNNPRCILAWEIAGRYFDKRYVKYIDSKVVGQLDPNRTNDIPKIIAD